MFQITEFTYARLASLTPRVEKHGDDNKPAVSIRIEIEAPNVGVERMPARADDTK